MVVASVIEETEIAAENTEGTVALVVEAAPVTENRIIVYEYPTAGVAFDPPFNTSLPYHELVGGFSVPIGYARLYETIWKKFGHMIVDRNPGRAYALTMQVGVILRVVSDMHTRPRNTVTPDILFDWEFNLENSERLGLNVKWLRKQINVIKDSCEKNIPFPNDAVKEKEDKISKLTEELNKERAALQILKDADERKPFLADLLNF